MFRVIIVAVVCYASALDPSFGQNVKKRTGIPDLESLRKQAATGRIKLYGKDHDPNMKAMGFNKEFTHVVDFRNTDEFSIQVHYIDNRTQERKEIKSMEYTFEWIK